MNLFTEMRALVIASLEQMQAEGALPEGLDFTNVAVEPPRDALHGDMATNAAMVLAKPAGKPPRELAEKLSLVLIDDADIENAINAALVANFYSTGQVCSNGTRVFVQKGIKEAFLKRLAERVAAIKIGDPLDEDIQMGPMASQAQLDIVQGFIKTGLDEGARMICGGNEIAGDGFYIKPVVFADVTDDMTIAREEIFGPVMSVLDFDAEEEVILRANDTDLGLAGGVFTQDITRAHRVIDALDAGTCYINTYNDAPVEAPFGGMKGSGVGRENSKAAIEHYSQLKTVYVKMGPVDAPY